MREKIKELAIHENDVGSSEVQVVQLTKKIEVLSNHIKNNKKDKHSSVGLLKAVNKRKKLLEYLKNNKADSYKKVISKLNIRK
ncbi:MAG: 30S ribosomal protein S15 [Candidatus Pelagibacter sp.]|nr:30S ribosomal protein S15 [Candidatus Pelagibacter sp.]|tara:strand:+ start:172 stop:420 length:249 start_codon:yes stop_codon:yes gene_type:complete